ncbi:MOSC domain-containing protein [Vibrio alginolyticus]|nr:MOSC domain-containing protein [Vibrio alginolyticus]
MIDSLFIKNSNQDSFMTRKEQISVNNDGIDGHIKCHTFRQVLILPSSTLKEFNLKAGQLKENIVINDEEINIHSLPSGTVLQVGSAKIRLTFHCEPCAKIKNLVSTRKVAHKRGYLGQIVHEGIIKCGDKLTILPEKYESIPYQLADRIKWYLDKREKPVMVSELVSDIGLSKSYCRAVPNIIRNRDDIDKSKILFAGKSKASK